MVASQAINAAPVSSHVPVNAMFRTPATVSFNVRNESNAAIKLRVKDGEVVTVDAGKVMPMTLPAGAQLIVEEATPKYPAGSVIAVVSNLLKKSTVILH